MFQFSLFQFPLSSSFSPTPAPQKRAPDSPFPFPLSSACYAVYRRGKKNKNKSVSFRVKYFNFLVESLLPQLLPQSCLPDTRMKIVVYPIYLQTSFKVRKFTEIRIHPPRQAETGLTQMKEAEKRLTCDQALSLLSA